MTFGKTPTTTTETTLPTNQVYLSSVAVPNHAGGDLTATEGGPASTDANGNETAPASVYVKDGGNVTQGTSTDANTVNSVMGRLTKIRDLLLSVLQFNLVDSAGVNKASVSASGAVKVDGSGVTQTVSGTITANAGTNLNTSLLALESGGNLAGINTKTPSLGSNTSVNSSPVVIASDQVSVPVKQGAGAAAGTGWRVESDYLEVPFSTTTAQVVANTDAANYRWVEVIITSQGTTSTASFQVSGNNSNFVAAALEGISSLTGGTIASSSTTTGIWYGPLNARYFQLNITGISAGTTAGIIRFHTLPSSMHSITVSANQNGVWTVLPGNTPNTTAWLTDGAAQQGPVNITNAGGASGGASPTFSGTCTASADNSITFASKVRTVQLHNQSAVNVPYEHDIASTATSPYLAPGQLVYVDVHTTTLHVFPSNALPINAASGLIVRGWN